LVQTHQGILAMNRKFRPKHKRGPQGPRTFLPPF
jgi:hypothetical protein